MDECVIYSDLDEQVLGLTQSIHRQVQFAPAEIEQGIHRQRASSKVAIAHSEMQRVGLLEKGRRRVVILLRHAHLALRPEGVSSSHLRTGRSKMAHGSFIPPFGLFVGVMPIGLPEGEPISVVEGEASSDPLVPGALADVIRFGEGGILFLELPTWPQDGYESHRGPSEELFVASLPRQGHSLSGVLQAGASLGVMPYGRPRSSVIQLREQVRGKLVRVDQGRKDFLRERNLRVG